MRARGTSDRRQRPGPARRMATSAVALALAVGVLAACGATRSTSIPEAGEPPTTPPKVEDPADAPQLAALPTVVTRPDTSVPTPRETYLDQLAPTTRVLLDRLGRGTRFTSVRADTSGIEWEVEADTGGGFTDVWTWRTDTGDGPGFEVRKGTTPTTDEFFSLAGVDMGAPARIEAGVERLRPASYVNDAELTDEPFDGFGLAWRLDVYSPGDSSTVVAAPSGDVVAVT